MTFFVTLGAVYSLQSGELFLTVLAAIVTGYLGKLLFDRVRSKSDNSETDELQLELETLQNKFSSEILRKEEAELLMQDELKAAEKRHMELQVQYAKALTHIDQLRTGAVTDSEEVQTGEGQKILQNLQDKIARQERALLELEQQLQKTEQEKIGMQQSLEHLQNVTDGKNDSLKDQLRQEQLKYEERLQLQLEGSQKLKEQFDAELAAARTQVENLEQQLQMQQVSDREMELAKEVERLQKELRAATDGKDLTEEILIQKAGITDTRIQAIQIADKIEDFRDHLTAILRDTYSYEQLLASNERLNETIIRLQHEKRSTEDEVAELKSVAEEKEKIEEELQALHASLQQKETEWKDKSSAFETSLMHLNRQVHEKEKTVKELAQEKDELLEQIEALRHKLDEREQLSKEMILAMKDIETRFAHFHHATAEAAIVNGNGEMHYR